MRAAILAARPQLGGLEPPITTSSAHRAAMFRFVALALHRDVARRPSAEALLRLSWLAGGSEAEAADGAPCGARSGGGGGCGGGGCLRSQSEPQAQRQAPRQEEQGSPGQSGDPEAASQSPPHGSSGAEDAENVCGGSCGQGCGSRGGGATQEESHPLRIPQGAWPHTCGLRHFIRHKIMGRGAGRGRMTI